MVTIRDVCMQVCTHHPPLIAVSRHKDVKTAMIVSIQRLRNDTREAHPDPCH